MDDVKIKRVNIWTAIGMGGYFAGVCPTLIYIFEDVFTFPTIIAFALAVLITSLSLYPIFIQGTANPSTKDKRPWTFQRFAIGITLITILVTILLAILKSRMRV